MLVVNLGHAQAASIKIESSYNKIIEFKLVTEIRGRRRGVTPTAKGSGDEKST